MPKVTVLVKGKDWTRIQGFCFPDQSSLLSRATSCPIVDNQELLVLSRAELEASLG